MHVVSARRVLVGRITICVRLPALCCGLILVERPHWCWNVSLRVVPMRKLHHWPVPGLRRSNVLHPVRRWILHGIDKRQYQYCSFSRRQHWGKPLQPVPSGEVQCGWRPHVRCMPGKHDLVGRLDFMRSLRLQCWNVSLRVVPMRKLLPWQVSAEQWRNAVHRLPGRTIPDGRWLGQLSVLSSWQSAAKRRRLKLPRLHRRSLPGSRQPDSV